MSEKLLQEKIIGFCKKSAILSFKFASPAHRGVPDLILFGGGHTVLIELKNPNGKGRLSTLQARTISKIRDKGIPVYVIDNYDLGRKIISEEFGLGPT